MNIWYSIWRRGHTPRLLATLALILPVGLPLTPGMATISAPGLAPAFAQEGLTPTSRSELTGLSRV